MTPLSHSAAHEQLADLALEPAALQRLARSIAESGAAASGDALGAHVMTCADCRSEIENWERVHGTVREALRHGDDTLELADLADDGPIHAPVSLRAAVRSITTGDATVAQAGPPPSGALGLPIAAATAQPATAARILAFPRPSFAARLMPLAAVLAIVALAGGMLFNQSRQLDRATADAASLAAVTATLDRVILDPSHKAIELRAPDGTSGGSVVWSSQDLVVLTTALAPPGDGAVYRCWIERDGERSPIGRMFFASGTGYWTGSLDAWATTSFAAGSTFGISLEPASGSRNSPAVLEAQFGS